MDYARQKILIIYKKIRELLEKTGLHSGKWLTYYYQNKDEIIYNPKYSRFEWFIFSIKVEIERDRNEIKRDELI